MYARIKVGDTHGGRRVDLMVVPVVFVVLLIVVMVALRFQFPWFHSKS